MTAQTSTNADDRDRDRFVWLEDPGRDFPYHLGQPASLSA
jgi:hypothetical protein